MGSRSGIKDRNAIILICVVMNNRNNEKGARAVAAPIGSTVVTLLKN